jgi:hypothetical protein
MHTGRNPWFHARNSRCSHRNYSACSDTKARPGCFSLLLGRDDEVFGIHVDATDIFGGTADVIPHVDRDVELAVHGSKVSWHIESYLERCADFSLSPMGTVQR